MTGTDNKYLIAGINNELYFITVNVASLKTFKLNLISKLFKNTCIQDIKIVDNTIFVGDLMKSVTVFEIKDTSKPGVINTTPKLQIMQQNF
jgi:hypothetical protein